MGWKSIAVLLLGLASLGGCERSIDTRLAAQAAAEQALGVTPQVFAAKFNAALSEVLARRPEPDSARLAPLYAIDPNHLHAGDKQLMLETRVGPSSTTLLGTLAKNGELKTIGALLAERSQAASGEFFLCAETIAQVFAPDAAATLPALIKRLTNNAVNNPGQRLTEVVSGRLLSAEIIPQGLLFQVEQVQ